MLIVGIYDMPITGAPRISLKLNDTTLLSVPDALLVVVNKAAIGVPG